MWFSAKVYSSPSSVKSAAAEHGSRVIDQDVDARLLVGDFGGHAFHLRNARQIGVMDRVAKAWRPLVKPR